MSKYLTWLALPLALSATSVAWAAPTKSFTAAVASLPADTETIGSSNLKSLRSTQIWKTMFPELLKMEQDIPEAIDKVKKSCSIDLVGAADDITLGIDSKESGAVFISVAGVTEDRLTRRPQVVHCWADRRTGTTSRRASNPMKSFGLVVKTGSPSEIAIAAII